jgi:hypothetical protein
MIHPESAASRRPLLRLILVLVCAACTDASQVSIEISQALLSTDKLQSPSPGQVCAYVPQVQAGGFYKSAGFLELGSGNPFPEYVLAVQAENYLDNAVVTDSNGGQIVGPSRNDFHVESFTVNYLDVGGQLGAISPQTVSPLTAAVVRPGGTQGATAVLANMLPPAVVNSLQTSMRARQLRSAGLVLEVQANGRLGSGEPISSGFFRFPLTLAFTPAVPGEQLVADTFGPCCANEDFAVFPTPCGSSGEPCCNGSCTGVTADGGKLSCQHDVTVPIGTEDCGYFATPFLHCR